MTTPAQINEIVSLYTKHGWKLRRVLLSRDSANLAREPIFDGIDVRDSSFDALWFSRRSRPGTESWELRRLAGTAFALVEVFEDETPDEEIEERLAETESRMMETFTRGNGHG